jgi:RimJ/RimL family protein N-acetyltransferase
MFGPELLGESIRLRPLVLGEAEEWLAGEDDEQIRWFEAPAPSTLSDVTRAIGEWQSSWRDLGPVRHWGIRPLDADTLFGGVELRELGDAVVNLSYLVFPPYRRAGIAVSASKVALRYATKEMGARQAMVKVLQGNEASLAVARRLGAEPSVTEPSDLGGTHLINVIQLI